MVLLEKSQSLFRLGNRRGGLAVEQSLKQMSGFAERKFLQRGGESLLENRVVAMQFGLEDRQEISLPGFEKEIQQATSDFGLLVLADLDPEQGGLDGLELIPELAGETEQIADRKSVV